MVSFTKKNISHLIYHISETHQKDFVHKVDGLSDGVISDHIYLVYVKNYLHSSQVQSFKSRVIEVTYLSEGEEKIVVAENFIDKLRLYFDKIPIMLVGENPKTKELDIIL